MENKFYCTLLFDHPRIIFSSTANAIRTTFMRKFYSSNNEKVAESIAKSYVGLQKFYMEY